MAVVRDICIYGACWLHSKYRLGDHFVIHFGIHFVIHFGRFVLSSRARWSFSFGVWIQLRRCSLLTLFSDLMGAWPCEEHGHTTNFVGRCVAEQVVAGAGDGPSERAVVSDPHVKDMTLF